MLVSDSHVKIASIDQSGYQPVYYVVMIYSNLRATKNYTINHY